MDIHPPTRLRTRGLSITILSWCCVCRERALMRHWDGDFMGPICPACVQETRAAEIQLLAAGYRQPEEPDFR